jgi:hypothetical protein
MAAISALLLACVRLMSDAEVIVLPRSYSETLELIESHVRQLRLIRLDRSPAELPCSPGQRRVLLLDSCTSAAAFKATLDWAMPPLDLVVFDTTCFCSGSKRIGRVLSWARRWDLPIVLVRSHTKLDSLGVEYGRLGSAVFVRGEKPGAMRLQVSTTQLAQEMRNTVRLFGGAALPAHFPPYVGIREYRTLTSKRMAAILRNSRRMARHFMSALPSSSEELHFAHGLYVTLAPIQMLDETQTKQIAEDLCNDLRQDGLPVRHAGSFGFDFGAAEWFHDSTLDRCLLRIAVPDLPTSLWDQVTRALAQWWSRHEKQKVGYVRS